MNFWMPKAEKNCKSTQSHAPKTGNRTNYKRNHGGEIGASLTIAGDSRQALSFMVGGRWSDRLKGELRLVAVADVRRCRRVQADGSGRCTCRGRHHRCDFPSTSADYREVDNGQSVVERRLGKFIVTATAATGVVHRMPRRRGNGPPWRGRSETHGHDRLLRVMFGLNRTAGVETDSTFSSLQCMSSATKMTQQ